LPADVTVVTRAPPAVGDRRAGAVGALVAALAHLPVADVSIAPFALADTILRLFGEDRHVTLIGPSLRRSRRLTAALAHCLQRFSTRWSRSRRRTKRFGWFAFLSALGRDFAKGHIGGAGRRLPPMTTAAISSR